MIDLTNFVDADGFIIQGDAAGDEAGRVVAAAGDVNGDGIDDLIVGAYRGGNGGLVAGEAYVIYGSRPSTAVLRNGTEISQVIWVEILETRSMVWAAMIRSMAARGQIR